MISAIVMQGGRRSMQKWCVGQLKQMSRWLDFGMVALIELKRADRMWVKGLYAKNRRISVLRRGWQRSQRVGIESLLEGMRVVMDVGRGGGQM